MASGDYRDLPLKIHLCCGDVYLDGYWNVDAVGKKAGRNNPNRTTLDKYYRGKLHSNRQVFIDEQILIPHGINYAYVDEYLMISAFEHLSLDDAENLIIKVYNSLSDGGVFRFDFPDIEKTVKIYRNKPEYMMRLIYGSGKNEYGFHRHGYTVDSIKKLLSIEPWKSIKVGDIVKHDYPMIGITATK